MGRLQGARAGLLLNESIASPTRSSSFCTKFRFDLTFHEVRIRFGPENSYVRVRPHSGLQSLLCIGYPANSAIKTEGREILAFRSSGPLTGTPCPSVTLRIFRQPNKLWKSRQESNLHPRYVQLALPAKRQAISERPIHWTTGPQVTTVTSLARNPSGSSCQKYIGASLAAMPF